MLRCNVRLRALLCKADVEGTRKTLFGGLASEQIRFLLSAHFQVSNLVRTAFIICKKYVVLVIWISYKLQIIITVWINLNIKNYFIGNLKPNKPYSPKP